ncbi:hypothetical protein LTR49_009219 [Elasticomyces elasticus]|nr:hypothetical protein LTR49_009219 [Elasticomyces elasticus]
MYESVMDENESGVLDSWLREDGKSEVWSVGGEAGRAVNMSGARNRQGSKLARSQFSNSTAQHVIHLSRLPDAMGITRVLTRVRVRAVVPVLRPAGGRPYSSKVSPVRDAKRTGDHSKEQEDFYQWYLRKSRAGTGPVPGDWAHRLRLEECESAVPSHLREKPLEAFKSEDTELELGRRCLELFIARHAHGRSNTSATRASYAKEQPGSRALLWYLGVRGYERFDLLLSPGYMRCLTYALAAEQADQHFWKWLMAPHVPEYAKQWPLNEQRQWKGRALRQFVESKVCWAENHAEQLHDGLETFTCAATLTADVTEQSYIPKPIAGRWLSQQFMVPSGRRVRVEDHERMMELIPTFAFEPFERYWTFARLEMAHPTNPKADEAFAFFMASEEFQKRSEFLMDRAGRTSDARTMLDFGRRRMPEYFTPRRFDNPYKDRHITRALDTGIWDAKKQIPRAIQPGMSDRQQKVSESFAKYNEPYMSDD